jgi:hypothetical protein
MRDCTSAARLELHLCVCVCVRECMRACLLTVVRVQGRVTRKRLVGEFTKPERENNKHHRHQFGLYDISGLCGRGKLQAHQQSTSRVARHGNERRAMRQLYHLNGIYYYQRMARSIWLLDAFQACILQTTPTCIRTCTRHFIYACTYHSGLFKLPAA